MDAGRPGHGDPRPIVTGGLPPRRLVRGGEQLRHLVGAYLLVGITTRDEQGRIVTRQQFHGQVTDVAEGVVVLGHAGGELLLPAEPAAYSPARPGRYVLASGEVVISPDYLSTWSVSPAGMSPGDAPAGSP